MTKATIDCSNRKITICARTQPKTKGHHLEEEDDGKILKNSFIHILQADKR